MHPAFLYPGHPLASVAGPFNAVTIESPAITEITISGPGAGGPQTASAVLGDVISAMIPPASTPETSQRLPVVADVASAFYLHLYVDDEPGVLAQVAQALGAHGVSVKSVVQKGLGDQARLVMVLHRVPERQFMAALDEIAGLEFMRSRPRFIRVIEEEFGSDDRAWRPDRALPLAAAVRRRRSRGLAGRGLDPARRARRTSPSASARTCG